MVDFDKICACSKNFILLRIVSCCDNCSRIAEEDEDEEVSYSTRGESIWDGEDWKL